MQKFITRHNQQVNQRRIGSARGHNKTDELLTENKKQSSVLGIRRRAGREFHKAGPEDLKPLELLKSNHTTLICNVM